MSMSDWAKLCTSVQVKWKILCRLEESGLTEKVKEEVLETLLNPAISVSDLEDKAYEILSSSCLAVKLKNAIYKELISLSCEGVKMADIPVVQLKEPVEHIYKAQESWEKKLKLAISKLCCDYNTVLDKPSKSVKEGVVLKWNSIRADYPELFDRLHALYSPKDFLRVLILVRDPDYITCPFPTGGMGKLPDRRETLTDPINVKSLFTLREQFQSLHPSQVQVESGSPHYLEKSSKVLKLGLWSLARELCKTGCPVGQRRELWSNTLAIDSSSTEGHASLFEELKSAVLHSHMVFEQLLVEDVKRTAANDDNYFVFEDVIHQVLLCMLHDASLSQHLEHLRATSFSGYIRGKGSENKAMYPPSGIIPFHGFSLYVAPLCLLFDRADYLYALFKVMYIRFFVHLHTLSSHPQGILSLCSQFECLLQCREPELVRHLKTIYAEPLHLVFSWLMSAFSGYLDTREVLLLWDRIIGHNSLTIVSIIAVAILEFRAINLFKATDQAEAQVMPRGQEILLLDGLVASKAVLADLRCVRILPLLQKTLFL